MARLIKLLKRGIVQKYYYFILNVIISNESDSEEETQTLFELKNGALVPFKLKTSRKHSPALKKRAASYGKSPIPPSPARRKRQTRTPERYDRSPPPTPTFTRKKMMMPCPLQV